MPESDTLALSEDQHALQDTLRGFLADQLPSTALRTRWRPRPGTARSCTHAWWASSA